MRTTRLVAATGAALLCLGTLSACGPENSDPNASKTTAPAAVASTSAATGAPATGGAKPTGGASAPAGGGIPAKAWMDTKSIPMDETLHWAPLAANAKPVTGTFAFKGQELCHAAPGNGTADMYSGGEAKAKAQVGFGGEHWTAQQTLYFFADPAKSHGNQAVTAMHEDLEDAVKNCAKTAPGATVKVSSPDGAPFLAATVTIPQSDGSTVTLHEYLSMIGGTVSELSVFATTKAGAQPKEAWKAPEDKYVATGMTAPICEALPGC